jgi:hypothetical protein
VKITIAFYKGEGDILNKIVRWWTNSKYSHAEMILDDQETWISISPKLLSKIDSTRRFFASHTEWDFIPLEVTEEQYKTILDFFNETRGSKYDWFGMLLSQFLPFRIKTENRWYCSEWIAYALRIASVVDWKTIKIYERKDLSPSVLHDIVTKIKENERKKIQG